MQYWLTAPDTTHIDPLGLSLAGLALALLVAGLVGRLRAAGPWRHHPFRLMLGHYWGRGAAALGLLTAVAAASHAGAVPVYGTRLAGAGMIVMVAAVLLGAGLGWRFRLATLMTRYDQRYPEVLAADAGRAEVVKLETPMWSMIFVGVGAYLAFVWHPWNHVFHEGNIVLGALAGYAAGCLVGVLRYGPPPPPRVTPRSTRRAKPARRR
ncbi:MAG: hypothetical protein ACYDGR_05150 [Candidatus Dormibacteria bacterium]